MQRQSFAMMLVAFVVAAGVALWLKNRMVASNEAVAEPASVVLAATQEVPAGSFVRAETHLAWVAWPQDNINDGYFTPDEVKIEDFDGAVARRALASGEPITAATLVKSTEGGFLSAVLDAGKRAISIAVTSTSGNAGFIFPGDRVDLILTHRVPVEDGVEGGNEVLASETFVRDVRVLAVDQSLDNKEKEVKVASTVTLEVSPRDAEKVQVAEELGDISLSLRSLANDTSDEEALATRDSDVSGLLVKRAGHGASKVRLIKGNEAQDIEFMN